MADTGPRRIFTATTGFPDCENDCTISYRREATLRLLRQCPTTPDSSGEHDDEASMLRYRAVVVLVVAPAVRSDHLKRLRLHVVGWLVGLTAKSSEALFLSPALLVFTPFWRTPPFGAGSYPDFCPA